MESFFNLLAPREWVLIIFFIAFLGSTMAMAPTRKALVGIAHSLSQPKVCAVFGLGTAYIFALISGLYAVGVWQWSDVLATLFWMLTSAFVSIVNFQKAQTEPHYYRRSALEVFSLVALFVFLTDVVGLSLWFWLMAIPVMTFLQLLSWQAKRDPDHAQVARFLGGIEILAGLVILYLVGREVVASWDTIATFETVRLFLLSAILSIAFLPFIYGLALYAPYERIFKILPLHIEDVRLRRAARWRAVVQFGTNVDMLERWRRMVTTNPPTSLSMLKDTFSRLREIKKRERTPHPASSERGWPPQSAIAFLRDEGLSTNDYHEDSYEPGNWWACSPMTDIGDGIMPNNIAYYVYGDALAVNRLKLKLNVNEPDKQDQAIDQLWQKARALVVQALGDDGLARYSLSLAGAIPFTLEEDEDRLTLTRDDWKGGIPGGFSLIFEISKASKTP